MSGEITINKSWERKYMVPNPDDPELGLVLDKKLVVSIKALDVGGGISFVGLQPGYPHPKVAVCISTRRSLEAIKKKVLALVQGAEEDDFVFLITDMDWNNVIEQST